MNWLTIHSHKKLLERGPRVCCPVILVLIWMTSCYSIEAELFQMSNADGQQNVIKMSRSLSKRRTQLVLSGINNIPPNTSEYTLQHLLQTHNGYMSAPFGSSSHLTSKSKAKSAHQGSTEFEGRAPRAPEASIKSSNRLPVEDNVVAVVKRSILAESGKGSFYTSEESDSTTASYSSTSLPHIYFPTPR